MARRKNLTREDHEDVSTFENSAYQTDNKKTGGLSLMDMKIEVKCLNKKQKDLRRAIEEKNVVISTGPAGTGRTYLSLLTALHVMKTEPQYKHLILIKSLQTIKGEELGFLPGDMWEKIEPYMYSFTGNLDKILKFPSHTVALRENNTIKFLPIAYIRGVTIDNSIVIIDEAQNISMHTFKSIITRIGKSCKMIFLGDSGQIDLKNKEDSCLKRTTELFKDQEYAGSVVFEDEDSVRNPIIPELLKVLKNES